MSLLSRYHEEGIRQGSCVFLPRPHFKVPTGAPLLHHAPILLPGGVPHRAQWLYPHGLSVAEYEALCRAHPSAWGRAWQQGCYVMGKVRHPEHPTLKLPFWHLLAGPV